MIRLAWLSPERTDPEESFPALAGRRPAPEPIPFSEAPSALPRSMAEVVLVDGRTHPEEASALIRKLRGEIEVPFLIVLSDAGVSDFDWSCGAGDFVTERSSPAELSARLGRLKNPHEPDPADLIRRGDVTINRERFEVRVRGEIIDLTFKEFELLEYLASRPGRVCSRSELLTEVWGYQFFGGTRTVDVHVRRLRSKLGHAAGTIETVRNVGYRFAG
jgi:DNA-binding response OmpR family regulator